MNYQLGFWLALFFSLVAAAVNVYFYIQQPQPDLLAAPVSPPPYQPTYQPTEPGPRAGAGPLSTGRAGAGPLSTDGAGAGAG